MAECRHGAEPETDMPASHFEFHVEEVSMEAFLKAWLRRFLPEGCTFGIYPYPGKDALLRKIGNRLRGYATWMPAEYRIVVVVDCDKDECEKLKSTLERVCESAGLRSRRAVGGPGWQVVTRIAIEELEAMRFSESEVDAAALERVAGLGWHAYSTDVRREGAKMRQERWWRPHGPRDVEGVVDASAYAGASGLKEHGLSPRADWRPPAEKSGSFPG